MRVTRQVCTSQALSLLGAALSVPALVAAGPDGVTRRLRAVELHGDGQVVLEMKPDPGVL